MTTPATYTRADLLALPQTTVQTTRPTIFGPVTTADQGVSLQALVNLAHPVLPVGPRNPSLRVTINVDVALTQPRLVIDGDVKGGRYVSGTTKLLVGTG